MRMCMQGWGVGVEREKEHYVCTQERERERERKKKEHTHVVRGWGRGQGERKSLHTWERERARERLAPPFVCFLPLGLPYANWAQPGVLFYLKSSLWSSDLSLTFLCSIFVVFSLPCLLATSILDSFSLFYLPNKMIMQLKLLFLCIKMEKLTLKTFFFFFFWF